MCETHAEDCISRIFSFFQLAIEKKSNTFKEAF